MQLPCLSSLNNSEHVSFRINSILIVSKFETNDSFSRRSTQNRRSASAELIPLVDQHPKSVQTICSSGVTIPNWTDGIEIGAQKFGNSNFELKPKKTIGDYDRQRLSLKLWGNCLLLIDPLSASLQISSPGCWSRSASITRRIAKPPFEKCKQWRSLLLVGLLAVRIFGGHH